MIDTRRVARLWAGLAVAGMLALTACGDDDGDSDAATDTDEATDETVTDDGDDDSTAADLSAEFCQARVDVEQAFIAEDLDAAQAALEQLEAEAPDSLTDDAATVSAALSEDPDAAFEDPEFNAARGALDEAVIDGCGFQVVDVTASEYAFEGIPDSVDAGTTVFRLTNDGTEQHEVVIVGIPEDLDEPIVDFIDRVDELFESGDEEAAMELINFTTAAFATPGGTDVGIGQLEPGPYVALCFIPVGSVGEEEGDGPPHYHEGMYTEFTVN